MIALPNVLWIGGAPGSGKSTAARALARRHGLRRYNSDTRTWAHRDRALAAGDEDAARFEELTVEERGALPVVERRALDLRERRGPMAVDDLRALPDTPLTVAEGTLVAPAMLPPGGLDNAVWLTLAPETQLARLEKRHGAGAAPALYVHLGERIAAELAEAGPDVRTVPVDDLTPEQTLAEVEKVFAARLAEGPRAGTAAERRALLREANLDVVDQYETVCARDWCPLDIATVEAAFTCECDDPHCTAELLHRVSGLPDGPLLAPGHTGSA